MRALLSSTKLSGTRKHPHHHVVSRHSAFATKQSPSVYSEIPRDVVSVAGTARATLTVPDGSRLFLAPCAGGDAPFGYFILPKTNALWSTSGAFPIHTTDDSLCAISAPLTATNNSSVYAFNGTVSYYALEGGAKSKGLGSWSVAEPKSFVLGTQDTAVSTDQTISAKMTLAHLELDSTVSTTYAGKATVYAVSTDSAGLGRATMRLTGGGAQDSSTSLRVRRMPGGTDTQNFDDLRQVTARYVSGTTNRSFHQTGRLVYPQFWNSGQTASATSSSWSHLEIDNGMCPNANPFLGAAMTGVYLIVEASGAPVDVTVALNVIQAIEHVHRADTDPADTAFRNQVLTSKVHATTPALDVRQAAMAEVDHTTEALSQEAAREHAAAKIEMATPAAPVAPLKRSEPLQVPHVLDPPDDPDTSSVIQDIHNSDMPSLVKEILETGAGAGEVIGEFASDARQFASAASETVQGVSNGLRSFFGGIKKKWKGASKPKIALSRRTRA